MTTAFDVMMAGLMADPNIASSAVYQSVAPNWSFTVSVVMVRQADVEISPFGAKANQPRLSADIRISDLPQPAGGDSLTVGSAVYTVASFERDDQRLVWRLALRES